MTYATKPGPLGVKEERPLRGPTFKNSLRRWQARWKAQQARAGDEPGRKSAAGSPQ